MNGKLKVSYEFGDFRLIPDESLLLKNGAPVPIPPKAFAVLVLLVQNSGELVEKQDLLREVWHESFVEEANIQVQISALRKALGDKENGKYIETVPKKGYRFNCEVKITESVHKAVDPLDENDLQLSAARFAKAKGSHSRLLKIIFQPSALLAVLLLLVFSTVGFVIFLRSAMTGPENFQKMDIAKLTTGGKVARAAISPDGTNLVYNLSENGLSSLRLRNLPSGAEKEIIASSALGFDSLRFSPDGNFIFYTQTDRNNLTNLYRISILSGEPRKLVEEVYGRVTFAPGGERMAFIRIDEKKPEFNLILARSDGTEEKVLAVSRIGELFHYPAWSPDGKTIALFKKTVDWDELGNRFRLIEIDAETGAERNLGEKLWQSISFIEWLRDGSAFLMTAADRSAAPSQVWLVDRQSGEARRITNDTNDYAEITVDDKAEKITAVQTYGRSRIWLNHTDGSFKDFAPVTTGPDAEEGNFGLSFAPGGKIAFSAKTNGNWDIWTMNSNGSDRRKLTAGDFFDIEPLFTPDGREIIYLSQVGKGQTHLWKMNADGSGKTQLTNGFFEHYSAVAPDGSWIVFEGWDSFQKSSLRKISIDGGAPLEIPNPAAAAAGTALPIRSSLTISPDGKLIAFASLDETNGKRRHKIFFIPLEGGEPFKTIETPPDFSPNTYIRWTPDGRAITSKVCSALSCNLWNLPVDGSPAVQLTDFKSDLIYAFDWSKDGKKLAVARGSQMKDVILISSFR